jgi:hypothetical protein
MCTDMLKIDLFVKHFFLICYWVEINCKHFFFQIKVKDYIAPDSYITKRLSSFFIVKYVSINKSAF